MAEAKLFVHVVSLWSSAIILLVLAMVVMDVMVYYFQMYLALLFIGFLHGLVFLPLEALYPDVHINVHEYGNRYCKGGVFGIYQGASNHEELHNLMKATIMICRLKKDVLSELPHPQGVVGGGAGDGVGPMVLISSYSDGYGKWIICGEIELQSVYLHALSGGPRVVFDRYLGVQQWRPDFSVETPSFASMPVWVRFPVLPLEYYEDDIPP
ncbi:hypothetical protein Syun_009838 [Stephania yunnanensis]|uniref:DUF4283 domain-containing protein n=1 Tax=Stephania yunnanensis TaxID=152371 RepID=A0AAP0KHG2_9MAGN